MKTKILALATFVAIAIGTAGFATTASAATPTVNLSAVANTTDSNVQNVYHRGYPGRFGHGRRRMCRRLYRRGFIQGYPWARRAYYRRGCHRRYRPYRPYYRGPSFGFRLSF